MGKIFKVNYILDGVTEHSDEFDNMVDGSVESAINAIKDKFNGVWGRDSSSIKIKSVISGHYEYIKPLRNRPLLLGFKGNRVFVED